MTVALLKSSLSQIGGIEKHARLIAKAFEERGFNVTVVSKAFKGPSYKKVQAFDEYCASHLKENPSDIVVGMDRNRFQTHLRAGNGVHACYLRRRSAGFFKRLSFRFNPLHRLILEIEKEAFEHPRLKKLIVNSHMVKEEVLHYYNVDPAKIVVIHNGVSFQPLQIEKQSEFEFLFVGNNFQRKGLDKLISALKHLKQYHLSVVGTDKNLSYYQALCESMPVTFYGEQKDVTPFYQKADALVIPSLYDPFANVTVEALAMGVQVISSEANGGKEVLTEETGFVVSDDYVPALEAAMKRPKTLLKAEMIRKTIAHLDFSNQLKTFVDICSSE